MCNDLVSIIVPVYNAEKTIRRCIDSIKAQTYHDFELILIDDGSSDLSGQICDAYAEKDSRIRVVHIPNGGVSHARNTGLDCANGEYISFVDADDWIDGTRLSNLLPENEEDFVYAGFSNVDGEKKEEMHVAHAGVRSHDELSSDYLKYAMPFVWCGCYRRKMIEGNHIRFDELVRIGEDVLFNLEYLKLCKCVRFSEATDYNHSREADSLVHRYYPDRIKKEERECKAIEDYIGRIDMRLRWYHWHVAIHHYEKWKSHSDIKIKKNAECNLNCALKNPYFRKSIAFIKSNGSLDERIEACFMYPSLRWIGKRIVKILSQIERIKRKHKE